MYNISLVLLTHNNSDNIKNNLNILKMFSDLLIVDDYSDDKSDEIYNKYKIKVYKRKLNGDFAAQRNFALEKTKNDWVLFLDSDEEIDVNLVKEAVKRIKDEKWNGFLIKRKVIFLGHTMSGTEMGNDRVLRLARKSKGEWVRKVHEYWNISSRVGILKNPIIHNTAPDIRNFVEKLTLYFNIHAKENIRSGKKSSLIKICLYTPSKFLYNFFILKGYRDGIFGFVVSILMSFHTFLSWSDSYLQSRN